MATQPSAFSVVYNGKQSIALHSPYLLAILIVIGNPYGDMRPSFLELSEEKITIWPHNPCFVWSIMWRHPYGYIPRAISGSPLWGHNNLATNLLPSPGYRMGRNLDVRKPRKINITR